MPSLSVIIVNYKSWPVLRKNLTALVSCIFSDFEFEIIVVDNCSNDGNLETFKGGFPEVIFKENDGNWGFAHGCNLGASIAKGEILLFLNPDTIATQEAIQAMFWHYKSDSQIGILSCKQSEKPRSYQKVRPSIYTLFGLQRSIYKLIFKEKYDLNNCEKCQQNFVSPEWISGSVVMISKTWFKKVGGWNTDYWMYFEDVELSIKIAELGGKLQLLCNAFIFHEHGGTSRINLVTTALTKTEVIKSHHIYIQKNFSTIQKLPSHILVIANVLLVKGLFAILGCCFYYIPKAKLQTFIFKNCLKYYFSALKNRTWLSERSAGFSKK
jgi:GT2 family glycosyltransferase